MSREKNDPGREIRKLYEKPTVLWYLIWFFLILFLFAAVHLLVQVVRLTFSWYAIPESLIIALGVAGYFLNREATPAESAPVPAQQSFLSVNWLWFVIIFAAVGALVIGFVIHYRSAIPIIPVLSLLFGITVGVAVLVWIVKKMSQYGRTTQAEEDRKRMRLANLERHDSPREMSIPDRMRKAQMDILGYGLCLTGALFAIHFLLVPLLSYGAQGWERDFVSRPSLLPLCFYPVIALLTLSLLPMITTARHVLRFVATVIAFVALGIAFLLFEQSESMPPETARLLIEWWEFLWQPILVPHGWLFLFGAPIVIGVSKHFLSTWEEWTLQTGRIFWLIMGLNVWALFYFHYPS